MPNPKGNPNLQGGSRKGIPNKTTALLKDMILKALDGAGGVEYLRRQADENPGPFMRLVGKVLPMQIAGDPDNPLTLSVDMSHLTDEQKRILASAKLPGE